MKPMLALLGLTLACAALLAVTANQTRPKILANRQAAQQQHLNAVLAPWVLQQDAAAWVNGRWPICAQASLGRTQVMGYAGPIELVFVLAPFQNDNAGNGLRRVRVSRHSETPGIGDFFNHRDWLDGFTNVNLQGERLPQTPIDTISGATITANALRRELEALLVFEASTPTPLPGNACSREARHK